MPRPQPTQPDPDRWWPSCDQDQPGVSIRPLRQADLAALLAHFDQHPGPNAGDPPQSGGPAPVLAVRVRASVGRPGASAHAEYRRRRAAERAAWTSSLPWRAAAVVAAGLGVGLLGARLDPRLAAMAGVLAAVGLAGSLRFQPSADTRSWRRAAAGERRTARLLAPLERRGWRSCTTWPSPARQPISTTWSSGPEGSSSSTPSSTGGRLRLDPNGMLWHGRHLLVATLRKVLWQADQADEVLGVAEIQVPAIVAVHGAAVPWGRVDTDEVTVVPARQLPDLLWALPPILGPERVAWLADRARLLFHAAA
jgi:hypothetical protein